MGMLKKTGLFLGSLIILVISTRLFVFMFVALAPLIVARIVDRTPGKNISTTVGLFNFSGFAIYAIDMYGAGSLRNITDAIDPFKLMIVYLFAAIGWAIIWVVPKMTIILGEYRDEARTKAIRSRIEELEEEWSTQVRG